MKLLSSCFCLSLRTSTKLVCKSFMVLVSVTTGLNIYHLDYKGPRQESTTALGVVVLFLILLTTSAFAGHAGAHTSGLYQVLTSLLLLGCTIVHWVIVSCVSLSEDPVSSWKVCLQSRCPETLWMTDYGYGNSSHGSANNDSFTNRSLVYHNDMDPTYSDVIFLSVRLIASRHHVVAADAFSLSEADEFTGMEVAEGPRDYDGEDAAEEDRKAMPTDEKSVDFWDKSIRNKEDDSTSPPKGVHLIVSLAIFLAGFVYFVVCTIIICGHSAELYEAHKEDLQFDEEEEVAPRKENV